MMTDYAKQYTPAHLMAACAAREIKDGETAIVGIGLPLIAATIARQDHARRATIIFEGGTVGTRSRRMPWSISDSANSDFAQACMEVWRILGDQQAGYLDVGIVGGAQIDRFGNLNSTVITGQGDYSRPKVRMPGSGGGNDIASSCGRTIIMMRLRKNNFVQQVDYLTAPGHLSGGDARQQAGLRGGGPRAVITDYGIFRFGEPSKEMYLESIIAHSKLDAVREMVGWDLKVSPDLTVMEPPTVRHLEIMQRFDPLGVVLGSGDDLNLDDFDKFVNALDGIPCSDAWEP